MRKGKESLQQQKAGQSTNRKNPEGPSQLHSRSPWRKVTHAHLFCAPGRGKHCALTGRAPLSRVVLASLSRLLQKLNSFTVRTRTELTAQFPLISANKSYGVPAFSEHGFYELNKLYGGLIAKAAQTWKLDA